MLVLLPWLQSAHPCVQPALSTLGTPRIYQSAKHTNIANEDKSDRTACCDTLNTHRQDSTCEPVLGVLQ